MQVLVEGLPVGSMKAVEVLQEPEMGMLPCLYQFILTYEEPPLLYQIPFNGPVSTVVSHLRLQIKSTNLTRSVNELPDIYKNDMWYEGEGMDSRLRGNGGDMVGV